MSFMFNPYPYEDLNPVNRPKLPGQVASFPKGRSD
jgi:hypothetical protein